jgi:hypothetical protein
VRSIRRALVKRQVKEIIAPRRGTELYDAPTWLRVLDLVEFGKQEVG